MAEATQSESKATEASHTAHSQSRDAHGGRHVHHGRTPAAWVGVALAMLGFILGGIAVVAQNWTLFAIAAAICVVALIAAKVLQLKGYGAS